MFIYIDIETIPATMTEDQARSLVKVPGNIRKPESIAKHIAKSWPSVIERSSLDPHQGSIFCVVVAAGDSEPESFDVITCKGEQGLLQAVGYHLQGILEKTTEDCTLVTWNGDGFDLPYLWRRSVMHRGSLLADIIPHGERGRRGWTGLDLMRFWAGTNGFGSGAFHKMATVAGFLGIPCSPSSGADVAGMYRDGELNSIIIHCLEDVNALRAIHQRILGASLPF